MASIIQAIACPHCNCSATEDFYYKMGEKFIWCFRCGYYYEKIQDYYDSDKNKIYYKENEYQGYGIFRLEKEDEESQQIIFHEPLNEKEIHSFTLQMQEEGVLLENSYFVLFENGEFQFLAGNPPEDFYLSFEDYKQKQEENGKNIVTILPL
ncbi:hypothetical protein [Virgibacillus kimchii]